MFSGCDTLRIVFGKKHLPPQAPRRAAVGAYPNTIANLHILEEVKMPIKLDHPLVREQTTCPICAKHKDAGLLACWSCYREYDMRSGLSMDAELILDDTEDMLAGN